MIGDAHDEYDLVDPEATDPGATPPPRPAPPGAQGKPLPRMWKADDDAPPPRAAAPSPPPKKADPAPASRRRSPGQDDSSGLTRKTGLKPKPTDDGEKKVLVEETPVLDTYETRQRVRVATGAMFLFVIGLGCYIVYSAFLHDPFPMGDLPPDDGYVVEPAPVAPKVDVEGEARTMLARARESARNGRTDEAVALLDQLAKTYKGTRTADEAKAALERPSQNLPLFLEGPTVAAAQPAPTPPARPEPPPAVVDARPNVAEVRGNATLVAPTNPAEAIIAPAPDRSTAASPASPGEPPDRRLPSGFAAKPDSAFDPSGWPTAIVGDRDGAPMVFVPGNVFTMGDDRDPAATPVHKVRLSAFYIDQHEVTVGQFKRFLAESRYRGRSSSRWPQLEEKTAAPDDRPIVMVSHADALAFAAWAGKALPSEAQWEAAARTTDGRRHPWGDDPPKYARDRPLRQVDAVMSFPEDRSPYEAFDLAGNVLEWTADVWDRSYYGTLARQIYDDPTGPQPRTDRYDVVVKGGKGTGASREPINPGKSLNYVGFRCALQVERPAAPIAAPTAPVVPAAPKPAAPSGQPVVPF